MNSLRSRHFNALTCSTHCDIYLMCRRCFVKTFYFILNQICNSINATHEKRSVAFYVFCVENFRINDYEFGN